MILLFKRHFRDSLNIFVLFSLIAFIVTFILVWIFPTVKQIKGLQKIIEGLPLFVKAMLGKEILQITTFEGFMSIRYFNTAVVWIFSIFTILYCATMISADMETQRIELILAQPIHRYEVILARFFSYFLYLMGLMTIAFLGLLAGILAIHIKTDLYLFLKVFLSLLPLELAIGTICLFLSCLIDEPLKVTFYSLGMFILCYFMKAILTITPTLQFLQTVNIFYYFDATTIIKYNAFHFYNMAVLLGVSIFFFVASLVYFQRKEIYV